MGIPEFLEFLELCFIQQKTRTSLWEILVCGDPLGVRTQDPNIKSVVLYQLS